MSISLTIDRILSAENQEAALLHLAIKRNGAGEDTVSMDKFRSYWQLNGSRIMEEIRTGSYNPGFS